MHTRTTILFVLTSASCTIPGTIGDLPATTEGGDANPETGVAADSGADGHSSLSGADDGGTAETTDVGDDDDGADESDDEGDTGTTDPELVLCEHEPSGVEPGTALWTLPLDDFTALELTSTPGAIWMLGESDIDAAAPMTIATASHDGADLEMATWQAPDSVSQAARHLIALPGGRVVAGFDVIAPVEGVCPDGCADRWLVAYDLLGQPVWERSIGLGTWGVTASARGTIVVVGTDLDLGGESILAVKEFDRNGDVVRVVLDREFHSEMPIVTRAYAGLTGDVVALGYVPIHPDGGWMTRYDEDYDWSWTLTSTDRIYGAARMPDGDLVRAQLWDPLLLERATAENETVWQQEPSQPPNTLASDCDATIVLAGDLLERRNGDGTVQWSVPVESTIRSVAIADDGDILVLYDPAVTSTLERRAAL